MDIAVRAFDPTDASAAEHAYGIEVACRAADLPDFPPVSRRDFFGSLSHPQPSTEVHRALARLDGVPAGHLRVTLPTLDNTDNAEVEISVLPQHRRRGVGRELYEYAARLLRAEGRKRVVGISFATLAGGPARTEAGRFFARAVGATQALAEVRRRLDVTAVDHAALDRLLADAWSYAEGYSLVRWSGPAPEEYVADVAYLDSRLLADAPIGDLEWEPQRIDAARMRAIEAANEARGRRRYDIGMRHDATGRLVAWTALGFESDTPWHAWQQITIVGPGHRGHRLGLIIKIENLRYALANEPALRSVDTWNATANTHMIAINEAMGYRPVDVWENWQLSL